MVAHAAAVVPVDTAEVLALFNSRVKLAHKIANRFGRTYPWLADDFLSDGLLALLVAVRMFDPTRGVDFGRFATFKISKALTDRLRRERARHHLAFRDQAAPDADDPISSLADHREDASAEVEFNDLLAPFPPDRRDAMRRLSIGGETFAEVGAGQGVSAQTVRARMRADGERVKEKLAG